MSGAPWLYLALSRSPGTRMSFFLLCNDAVDPSRIDEFLETARQLIGIEHTIGALGAHLSLIHI